MIKNVKVIDGCISCRNCENICPKIFKVNPTSKIISNDFIGNETEILMAEAMCPVNVIKVEKNSQIKINFKESKILLKKYLTNDIIELILEKPKDFYFKAGQYISIIFEDWKGNFSRQYSIAEQTEKSFSLTIKLAEKGRGTAKLKKLKVGKKIKFLGPIGTFYLQDNNKEKYFISTGTGLAPFIAMAGEMDKSIKKYFIIGARKEKDLYYQDKLNKFENSELYYYLSQENTKGYKKGRVTDFLKNIPKQNAEIYICGNPNMVKEVLEFLEKNFYQKENIFSEGFTNSGKNESIFKEIFVNGKIPFTKQISLSIIGISFFLAFLYIFKIGNETLYDRFLFSATFQSFIFNLSWLAVSFVMIIRPLSDIFSKNNFLRKLKSFRKSFGILASILIIVNFTGKWFFEPSLIIQYFSNANRWNNLTALISRVSEWTAIILFLTSNNFSQEFLGKNWKKIQYLSYPFFITGAISGASYGETISDYIQYYGLLGVWAILWIIAFVKNKKSRV